MPALAAPFALTALAVMVGCSVVVDANRTQCSTDADCTARGSDFAGSACVQSFCQVSARWSCLDAPLGPPPASGSKFQVSFAVTDAVAQKPWAGLSARLCRKLDVACTDALSAAVVTDAEGKVGFEVPAGFDGYVRVEGTGTLPSMYFFNPPVARNISNIVLVMSSATTVSGLAALAGVTQDNGRGFVLLSVVDCTGVPASGVTLSSSPQDPQSRTFYAKEGFPSASATATDSSGYGGLMNASLGTLTLSASFADYAREIDEVTVLVQAATQTTTTLVAHGR
jgi:hypothetical protein